ncbi:MAG: ABC transporter ATP-binding protein [Leptolyngbyaceae bacterium]|nr:ABC transporter ATP-binding protein [Leptolyngbyaceae bacterium]
MNLLMKLLTLPSRSVDPDEIQHQDIQFQGDRPFRTLFRLYRHDAKNLGLSQLFYVIKHSPEWIRPILVANIVDIIAAPTRYELSALWFNGIILAILVAQNIPMHYLHVKFMSNATRNMEYNLRSAMTRRFQELSIGFYHQNSKGALQTKVTRDVESIQDLTRYVFQLVPSAVLTIAFALIATGIRASWFLIFFIGTVPVAATLVRSLRTPIRQRNRAFRKEIEHMSGRMVEMIQLIPVTRAHGAEEVEIERINDRLSSVRETAMRLDSINALAASSSWVTLRLFNGICLVVSAYLAYTGKLDITVGDVVLLTGYFDSLTGAIVQIMMSLPQIGKGFDAIRSVSDILECPDLEQNRGKRPIEKVRGEFVFDQVGFHYPTHDQQAIQRFSLHVPAGETIAIVGPSGAGKSTLLNLVIGFLRPTEGRILLDQHDMAELDLRTYRQFVSVVSQETILFHGTVRENVVYGATGIKEEHIQQAIAHANAAEFIEAMPDGLDTLIGEEGMKLSGGQRQRLAIARALIRNPRVLILDEATSALDTASEQQIQGALEYLMEGRTTFVVAHRLSTIRKADRIVVMKEGQMVEIGNHDRLVEQDGLYAHLHSLQVGH